MKNSQVQRAAAALMLIGVAAICGSATANTVSYDLFGDSKLGAIYGGQKLATVTLTDIAGGGVTFEVEAFIVGSQIAKFGFNFRDSTQPAGFSIPLYPAAGGLPQNWVYTVDIWTGGGTGNGGFNGFGKFDVDVKDGGNAGRLSPLVFDVSVGTIDDYIAENDPGQFFSAHVTNLNQDQWGSCSAADNGNTCTALTGYAGDATVVPVPAAVWLFGSGLLGLVGIARRKKS